MVGFDLDLTLIETGPGFEATLKLVGDEIGVEFPIAEMAARIGLPLEQILAFHLPEHAVPDAADRYRARYAQHGIAPTPALPGAHDALAAVRRHGGRSVLVTAKAAANAQLHVDALGFDVDRVQGDMWGTGKGETLLAEGASVYVGDHVLDVEGARVAGATAVSVLTGGCTREELAAAGTDVILDDLTVFPAWLDGYVLDQRLAALEADLRSRGSVLVAFSGGADSAFLLAAAVRALGADRVAAATAYSPSLASAERDPAREYAERLGVRVFTPETHELEREGYRANDGDRCYFCKAELIETLLPLADAHGLAHVATGTNADDAVAGFRPGIRAADERGAITPLLDAGLTKEQVRAASQRWELPTWDKPAAACLASRVAYGVEVTPHRLARVERAEAAVRAVLADADLESANLRVRDLGDRASVEVDAGMLTGGLAEGTTAYVAVLDAVRAAGFPDAALDPRGFRSGGMNELLDDPDRYR